MSTKSPKPFSCNDDVSTSSKQLRLFRHSNTEAWTAAQIYGGESDMEMVGDETPMKCKPQEQPTLSKKLTSRRTRNLEK